MKAGRRRLHAVLFFALTTGIVGCATSLLRLPQYANLQQNDSASLADTPSVAGPSQSSTSIAVVVEKVDGLYLNAPHKVAPDVYLSPGKHDLGLYAWWIDDAYDTWDCESPGTAEFLANHSYRITGSVYPYPLPATTNGNLLFDIGIWDEMGGAGNPVLVSEWKTLTQEHFDDSEPIEKVDYGGSGISQPPMRQNGHSPEHGGGVPSIPHNSRPPSGGGGGHGGGGGGHSGGGGGGGHRK